MILFLEKFGFKGEDNERSPSNIPWHSRVSA